MSRNRFSTSSMKSLFDRTFKRQYSEEVEAKRLERELENETKPPPDRRLDRIRRKGEQTLHSKQVLLAIVLLNLIDCTLVLGELILDIHYVKDILETSDIASQKFINKMEGKYPQQLAGHDIDHMELFFNEIYRGNCTWNNMVNSADDITEADGKIGTAAEITTDEHTRIRRAVTSEPVAQAKEAHSHSIWEDIAHGLHKASIAILGLLFFENILKVICMGKTFFRRKLEVFDAFIVIASFILDLVFLKGLTVYRIQDGIVILSFLLPWRVIRVVNSLIVAVLDHEHFRLKMMYKKQKQMAAELRDLKDKSKQFDFHLKRIERFCLSEGIPEWKVKHHTTFHRNQSTVSSMASYALGGMLDGLMGQYTKSKLHNRFSKNSDWDSISETSEKQSDFSAEPKVTSVEKENIKAAEKVEHENNNKAADDSLNFVFDSGHSSVSDCEFHSEDGEVVTMEQDSPQVKDDSNSTVINIIPETEVEMRHENETPGGVDSNMAFTADTVSNDNTDNVVKSPISGESNIIECTQF